MSLLMLSSPFPFILNGKKKSVSCTVMFDVLSFFFLHNDIHIRNHFKMATRTH